MNLRVRARLRLRSMVVEGYELIPDPGDDWSPTKAQVRRPRELGELPERAARMAAAAPPLSDKSLQRLAVLLSHKTPPSKLVEWRLRLFCGHETLPPPSGAQGGGMRAFPPRNGRRSPRSCDRRARTGKRGRRRKRGGPPRTPSGLRLPLTIRGCESRPSRMSRVSRSDVVCREPPWWAGAWCAWRVLGRQVVVSTPADRLRPRR